MCVAFVQFDFIIIIVITFYKFYEPCDGRCGQFKKKKKKTGGKTIKRDTMAVNNTLRYRRPVFIAASTRVIKSTEMSKRFSIIIALKVYRVPFLRGYYTREH